MTVFGPDISSYETGLNVATLPFPLVLAKASEGTYYTDSAYPAWRQQAARAGKLFVPYHFISGEDPGRQAAHLAACIGDRSLPVMLDWEPEGSFRPSLAQLLAVADAVNTAGMRVRLAYAPRWHWQEIGSPNLAGLAARRIGLVSSSYPGGTEYPGDDAAGWQAYGGLIPLLYQYTDHDPVQGQSVDMNAYRGTIEQLAARLSAASSTTSTGGSSMGTVPPSISQKWPELAGDFPPNAPFTDESALIWADAGARAAALYAQQARDAVNALAAKMTAPPPIDANALAAALRPLLKTGPSADEVAAAVVAHLAADLAKE